MELWLAHGTERDEELLKQESFQAGSSSREVTGVQWPKKDKKKKGCLTLTTSAKAEETSVRLFNDIVLHTYDILHFSYEPFYSLQRPLHPKYLLEFNTNQDHSQAK